jgi:arylsulfatase A-like enzyme
MKKPNILFILIDDLGWKDLCCYGSHFYETPNLDALARAGARFTDAYAACPVCSPTRASILAGKYPATVGITDWIDSTGEWHPSRGRLVDVLYLKQLPTAEYTIAQALRDGGYATFHVGKWHLGDEGHLPQDHGFETNIGGCHAGSPGSGGYFSPWSIPALAGLELPDGIYLTDYLTDQAIKLIGERDERPFFLNLWYYSVHTPVQAKPEKIKKYETKARAMGLDQMKTFEEGEYFPVEHKKHLRVKRRLVQSDPVYAAMIESLDENIGRLLGAIDETGEAENTIIIFTSDNGGLATAEGSPGVSLAPLLMGQAHLERDSIYWHYPHYGNQGGTPGSSIRQGAYKLIEFFEDGRVELYDLRHDSGEEHDLALIQPERVARMQSLLAAWRVQVEALIPRPNPDWKYVSP